MKFNARKEIESCWKRAHKNLPRGHSYWDEGKELDGGSATLARRIKQRTGPWVDVLTEGIRTLEALHLLLMMRAFTKKKPVSNRSKLIIPATLLASAACSQAVATRRLILAGLDLPARQVARGCVESMNAAIVTLVDNDARAAYASAQSFEESKRAWDRFFNQGRVRSVLKEIEEQVFKNDVEVLNEIERGRKEDYAWLSGHVHPSFGAAFVATFPGGGKRYTLVGASVPGLVHTARVLVFYMMISTRTLWDVLFSPGSKQPLVKLTHRRALDCTFVQSFHAFNHVATKLFLLYATKRNVRASR